MGYQLGCGSHTWCAEWKRQYNSDAGSRVPFLPCHQVIDSVLTPWTWRKHQIPQAGGSVPQDWLPPTPNTRVKCRLPPVCLTDGLLIRGSLGSINLLEWLTELRKPVNSVDHLFITKGCNSWKSRLGRCKGRGWKLLHPAGAGYPSRARACRCSPTQKLSNPVPLGIYGGLKTQA